MSHPPIPPVYVWTYLKEIPNFIISKIIRHQSSINSYGKRPPPPKKKSATRQFARLFNSTAKLANSICRSNATSKAASGASFRPKRRVRKEAAGHTGRWILGFFPKRPGWSWGWVVAQMMSGVLLMVEMMGWKRPKWS